MPYQQKLMTRLTTLALILGLGSTALAQSLSRALPEESILALGTEDLASVWDELADFRDEFDRLGVRDALVSAFSSSNDSNDSADDTNGMNGDGDMAELPDLEAFFEETGLEPIDVLGQEAWISVSASSFSPLPAVTLLARLRPEAVATVEGLLAEANAGQEVTALSEGDYDFFVLQLEDPDSPVQTLAYGQADDLLYLSSNPDTLRGVLRRLGGADEPGFGSSPGYERVFGRLGTGNFYAYLDYSALAQIAQPFATGFGFDEAVRRLSQALNTAGASGGVLRVTPQGLENEGFQSADPDGGDITLYSLLTAGTLEPGAVTEATAFAPEGALSYSSSYTDLQGWWTYLNDLSSSVPELGGDLNSLLESFTGIDLGESLFAWTGDHVVTITTGLVEAGEPGVPSENLLGDQVFMIATTDLEAAQAGLDELFETAANTLAAFTDPMGEAQPESSTEDIGGVSVTRYRISDGISVAYAVTDGYALIATSETAMDEVLEARASGANLSTNEDVGALLATVPEDVSSVSYSDSQASMTATAGRLSSQLQMSAGLTGSADLDFEAISQASATVQEYLLFIASRLGPSVGYSQRSPEGIYSSSLTPVRW